MVADYAILLNYAISSENISQKHKNQNRERLSPQMACLYFFVESSVPIRVGKNNLYWENGEVEENRALLK